MSLDFCSPCLGLASGFLFFGARSHLVAVLVDKAAYLRRCRIHQDRLERKDRDFKLVSRRLHCGESLQLKARPAQYADELSVRTACESQKFIADARDDRDQKYPGQYAERQIRPAEEAEEQEAHDEHEHQEAGPASRVERVELFCVLRAEHPVVFVAVDRLVLGAMVAEERLYVFHVAYGDDVGDKYEYPQHAFHEVQHECVRYPLPEEVHHPCRQYDEEHKRYDEREEESRGHEEVPCGLSAELLIDPGFKLARLFTVFFRRVLFEDVCRLHERAHSVYKRAHKDHYPAKERYLCGGRLLWLLLCP